MAVLASEIVPVGAELSRLEALGQDPAAESRIPDPSLELPQGCGGDESALFAADLLRMYPAVCGVAGGWKFQCWTWVPSDLGGCKEAVVSVTGRDVFAPQVRVRCASSAAGPHDRGAQGRIHTSW